MPITKEKASVPTEDIARIVTDVDPIIISLLSNWSGGYRCIDRRELGLDDAPYGVYSAVSKEIIRIYSSLGWTVTAESDQRDGEWLRFS